MTFYLTMLGAALVINTAFVIVTGHPFMITIG
jgi:hypothetical protein